MTPTETVMLCRFVKALCPQQAIDSYTPDAWHEVIGHLDLDECKAAVVIGARRSAFIAPAEIIAEVAAAQSGPKPHTQACRNGDHRSCAFGAGEQAWCMCVCHPRAVAKLAGPTPSAGRPELTTGPKRYEPGELHIGRTLPSPTD